MDNRNSFGVEVGCVQDAATEALKWRLPDAAEILGPIFEMFKARSLSRRP